MKLCKISSMKVPEAPNISSPAIICPSLRPKTGGKHRPGNVGETLGANTVQFLLHSYKHITTVQCHCQWSQQHCNALQPSESSVYFQILFSICCWSMLEWFVCKFCFALFELPACVSRFGPRARSDFGLGPDLTDKVLAIFMKLALCEQQLNSTK